MNILYICKDYTNWIGVSHIEFKRELSRLVDVTFYHRPCHLPHLIEMYKEQGKEFDVVMLGETPPVTPLVTGIDKVSLPKVVHYWDLHFYIPERIEFVKKNKIDLIVFKYKNALLKRFKQLMVTKSAWVPIGAASLFKDYQLPKTIDILLTGWVSPQYYPFRLQALKSFQGFPGFYYLKHPGYGHFKHNEAVMGADYARLLNHAKLVVTDGGKFDYLVAKYFEVPACKSALVTPCFDDLLELGYEPYKHFIPASLENLEETVFTSLRDDELVKEVSCNGHHLVHQKYTMEHMAKQFVNTLCALLGKPRMFESPLPQFIKG
ncbi:hypothetical protein DRO59_10075 [Candidatus Bathyarchaeota archaeon]|nr:MAG: hypothetical protein DRO59_10075 [Candidatus Bathyarchaeota archaeon]